MTAAGARRLRHLRPVAAVTVEAGTADPEMIAGRILAALRAGSRIGEEVA